MLFKNQLTSTVNMIRSKIKDHLKFEQTIFGENYEKTQVINFLPFINFPSNILFLQQIFCQKVLRHSINFKRNLHSSHENFV